MRLSVVSASAVLAALVPGLTAHATILAPPAVVDSATPYNDAYIADNVFDGTDADYASLGEGENTFLEFEFAAPQTFDSIVVISRNTAAGGDWIGSFTLTFDNSPDTITVERVAARGISQIHPLGRSVTATTVRLDVDTLGEGDIQNTGAMEIFFLSTPQNSTPVSTLAVIGSAPAYNQNYAAENAIDGDVGRSTGADDTPEYASASLGPETYLDLDFGAVIPVAGFDWFDRPAIADRTYAFDLIFSTNETFGDADDVVRSYENFFGAMALSAEFDPPIEARYVRYQVVEASSDTANAGVSEFRFYQSGPPATIPPSIVNQPASGKRYAKENYTFSVTVTGTPPLTYQWSRNGTPLEGADGPVLQLTGVTAADDGDYTVTVTNEAGSVTSEAAKLTVDATPGDPQRGLLIHLPFDEGSGLTAADAAGGDQPGTLENFEPGNSHWQPGKSGTAIFFNPYSPDDDDVVTIQDTGAFDFSGTKTFSIACWVNSPPDMDPFQANGGGIVCKGEGGGGEQFSLDLVTGGYRFYVWTGLDPNTAVPVATNIRPDGTWQHLCAVFNSADGRMKLYVNGVEAASGTPPEAILSNEDPITIGSRPFQGYYLNFAGLIDDVRIYDRDLSPLDIEAVMNAGPVDPPIEEELPELTVVRNGDQVVISWPAAVTGWTLEETTSPETGTWTASAGVVNNSLTITGPAGRRFYRLRKP